jgi:hypothetical protein
MINSIFTINNPIFQAVTPLGAATPFRSIPHYNALTTGKAYAAMPELVLSKRWEAKL